MVSNVFTLTTTAGSTDENGFGAAADFGAAPDPAPQNRMVEVVMTTAM